MLCKEITYIIMRRRACVVHCLLQVGREHSIVSVHSLAVRVATQTSLVPYRTPSPFSKKHHSYKESILHHNRQTNHIANTCNSRHIPSFLSSPSRKKISPRTSKTIHITRTSMYFLSFFFFSFLERSFTPPPVSHISSLTGGRDTLP